MALDAMPGCGQTPLGRALGFDKTTLSRNLRLMKRNGWIESASPVESGRAGYRLTAGGRGLFKATKPGWKRAQAKLRSAMKGEAWEAMMDGFGLAARAAFRASRD
jgi:DNA-binding MarR family transcriptional regulator